MTETLRTLGRRNILSISGGKDSTAMWLLATEQGINALPVFADTGHEHPLTYDYLDYLESKLGKLRRVRADFTQDFAERRDYISREWTKEGVAPEQIGRALAALVPTGIPFLDLCMLKGRFPSTRVRFCSEILKRDVIFNDVFIPTMDAGYQVISWQGIRRDESEARRGALERETIAPRLEFYRPLIHWSAADVFAMHKKHDIDPNPLYKLGMGRVGCMPCIHAGRDEIIEIAKRFPEEVARVERWEAIVSECSKHGVSVLMDVRVGRAADLDEIKAHTHGIRNYIDWARTARGGKIYNLASIEAPAACASQYGLCE